MKWFDRWFYRKARWCWHRAGVTYPELKAEQDYLDKNYKVLNSLNGSDLIDRDSVVCVSDSIDLERPIRFKVAAAEGGMIVEVSTYDEKKDRSIVKHHVIPDDIEDKAAAIARIVSWEFLRRTN
jgi:transposase InsO family protein